MEFPRPGDVEAIKQQLDHPVIDGDGHLIEYMPLVLDYLREDAGAAAAEGLESMVRGAQLSRQLPADQKRGLGVSRTAWWGVPTRNTLDRATAMLPRLMYERLDQLGVDFALLYPTYGLIVTAAPDAEVRQASARAFNRYYAEFYADYRDRLEPVAAIPMHTPDEAIAELDHAVGELGLKAVMMAGVIQRPVPGAEGIRGSSWVDTLGHDSDLDYDPVWRRCVELGVSPTFHASGQGWGTRRSRSNYVYNHLGNFAAAGEATCRSFFMGGVPLRFPELRFGFLEGGVAWGANLYSDILGHYEKRNREAIRHYDPRELDRGLLEKLFAEYGPDAFNQRIDRLDLGLLMLSDPDEEPASIDEFADSGVQSAEDIERIFTRQFFFGCEADDPLNALAFQTGMLPRNARIPAIFASDISHWDVPDFCGVLPEAWELVEDGHLDRANFRSFVFENVVSLLTGTNPRFFEGTAVEQDVATHLASTLDTGD